MTELCCAGGFARVCLDLLPRHFPDWRILKMQEGNNRNFSLPAGISTDFSILFIAEAVGT